MSKASRKWRTYIKSNNELLKECGQPHDDSSSLREYRRLSRLEKRYGEKVKVGK